MSKEPRSTAQPTGELNPKVMDVYAQLASGGGYSDVGEPPLQGTNEKKERKINFNNAPLNGGPQPGAHGDIHAQVSPKKGAASPKGNKSPKKGNRKGKK